MTQSETVMYEDYDFDLTAFVERMKTEQRILDVCDAIDTEIRRVDRLCHHVKGAVEARKKGVPYRESLKRLYLVMRLGSLPSSPPIQEDALFAPLLAKFSARR